MSVSCGCCGCHVQVSATSRSFVQGVLLSVVCIDYDNEFSIRGGPDLPEAVQS
jgi:hypothetical protein